MISVLSTRRKKYSMKVGIPNRHFKSALWLLEVVAERYLESCAYFIDLLIIIIGRSMAHSHTSLISPHNLPGQAFMLHCLSCVPSPGHV